MLLVCYLVPLIYILIILVSPEMYLLCFDVVFLIYFLIY